MSHHYHFIGIAGVGMSGLARLLLERGDKVSGSDLAHSPIKETLRAMGAHLFDGHCASQVTPDATVIYSSDIPQNNPEYQTALSRGNPLLHRSELLALFAAERPRSIAVTGTHGKTTTTAFLTAILEAAKVNPSFAIGGYFIGSGLNSAFGKSPYFVFEADESDGSMARYHPYGAIITNVDDDHLAHYGSLESLECAIASFAKQVISPAHLVWCGDDARLAAMTLPGISYGYGGACYATILHSWQSGWHTFFDLRFGEKKFDALEVAMSGEHMALNAAAACCLALQLGIDEEAIRYGLRNFSGVHRRMERLEAGSQVCVIDDYAHHPSAIAVTLRAIRKAIDGRRLIAVYQPHRYSRMAALSLDSFRHAFDVDSLYLIDLYSAGEEPVNAITAPSLSTFLAEESTTPVFYCHSDEKIFEILDNAVRPHDVVVFMGAGNSSLLAHRFADRVKTIPRQKWKVGIVCGGPSPEHAISLRSAQFVSSALDRENYEASYFYVSQSGQWNIAPDAPSLLNGPHRSFPETAFPFTDKLLVELESCDLFFPVMHGSYGEDGVVQGLFDALRKPYVGCDHRAAALCMDKVLCKKIASYHGIPTAPFFHFSEGEWYSCRKSLLSTIVDRFAFPVIVKPSHSGSSVGLSLAHDIGELVAAIEEVFCLDEDVLVEQKLLVRDIEFALLGNNWITVLPPGEIITGGKPYDYQDKVGKAHPPTTPYASLSYDKIEQGKEVAKLLYRAFGCKGLARLDFLLDEEGTFWFGEANPIPGLTSISLYPQMCALAGIAPSNLIDRLAIYALEVHRSKTRKARYSPYNR